MMHYRWPKRCVFNSAYGAFGSPFFVLYDTRLAEAITSSGRLSIKWVAHSVNQFLQKYGQKNSDYIIASDTDSIYLTLIDMVRAMGIEGDDVKRIIRFMDKFCDGPLQECINDSFENLKDYVNAYQQKMFMKREALANKGVWTGKKRYFLNVHNLEGVEFAEPTVKITGLEAVRSTTPPDVRKKIKDALKVILNENEPAIWKFIKDYREAYRQMELTKVSFGSTVNGLTKYQDIDNVYTKGTPMHVRAALVMNNHIEKMNLEHKYQMIKEGTKIKYAFLKMPNPIGEDVIAWETEIPSEFGIMEYIDYERMFERAFLNPIDAILQKIGWSHRKVNRLSSYM